MDNKPVPLMLHVIRKGLVGRARRARRTQGTRKIRGSETGRRFSLLLSHSCSSLAYGPLGERSLPSCFQALAWFDPFSNLLGLIMASVPCRLACRAVARRRPVRQEREISGKCSHFPKISFTRDARSRGSKVKMRIAGVNRIGFVELPPLHVNSSLSEKAFFVDPLRLARIMTPQSRVRIRPHYERPRKVPS